MTSKDFADRLRSRQPAVGYWVMLDAPPATERIALVGYDYVVLDAQHGLLDARGILDGLMAIDAAGRDTGADTVGLVRVEANNATPIGRALDAGAAGVIVPLIDTAEDAVRAVRAAKYPPDGIRSYGPARSGLRIGPTPAEANAATVVLAMIETRQGLENVAGICATPGLDGIYVGPSDLRLAVGGKYPGDPDVDETFNAAIDLIARTAAAAGVAAGIHTHSGEEARAQLAAGYTFATVSSDLDHLQSVAAAHLATVRA